MHLVWLTGIAAFSLFCGIAWYLAPLEPGILALQFAFTPRAFGEVVHIWTGAQLDRFRTHLPFDQALLLSYGLFGYLLATRTRVFGGLAHRHRLWAAWALPLAAAFDATENALHWWLTEVPRLGVQFPYLLAATCATAKWALLAAFALAAALAAAFALASAARADG